MGSARETTLLRSTPVVDETPVVRPRKPLTDKAVVVAFKPVIQSLSEKTAATLSSRSEQAVKHWRAGTRRIDTVSLLNLARDADPVWEFICQQAGRAPIVHHADPQTQHLISMLEQYAVYDPSPKGEFAREILRKVKGLE